MKKFKKPLLFSLAIMPVSIIAIIFTCLYQFDLYSTEMLEEAIQQLGSKEALIAVTILQNMILILLCSFFGYILSEKIGLWKPFAFDKEKVLKTVCISIIVGIIFSLDYWTFGSVEPMIQESTRTAAMSFSAVIASILYGGVNEEILMRLFFMSLIAFGIWKTVYRKDTRENIPQGVFIIANIVAALLFAAGHLPATISAFGALTPLILFRCFLLNGGFGLVFGRFYRKYGIWYAMLSHMLAHIVSKIIWYIFI